MASLNASSACCCHGLMGAALYPCVPCCHVAVLNWMWVWVKMRNRNFWMMNIDFVILNITQLCGPLRPYMLTHTHIIPYLWQSTNMNWPCDFLYHQKNWCFPQTSDLLDSFFLPRKVRVIVSWVVFFGPFGPMEDLKPGEHVKPPNRSNQIQSA